MDNEEVLAQLPPIELSDIVRYAGASGDFHAIHYDRELALSAGYEDNFAQGMFIAGILGGVVADHFGPENVREFGVRFVSPFWRGAVPTVRMKEESRTLDGLRLELEVLVGETSIVKGWAVVHDGGESHAR
jgi:3-hydroxybutyryl-CoA dehydratase